MGDLRLAPGMAESVVGQAKNSGSTHPNAQAQIDHCLVFADLAPRLARAWVDDQALGSDPWPLWVELNAA